MTTPKTITILNTKFTYYHVVIFLMTFFCYAFFHASRKTFSNVKTTISDEWRSSCDLDNNTCVRLKPDGIWNARSIFDTESDAKLFLGALDATFLGAYSIGLFISGILGDRFDLRYVLSIGMILSASSVFVFGVVTEWLHFYNKIFYIGFWILNGLVQSTGWPGVVAVMGNWFGKSGRGLIFGVWAANASVGNIIGALMVASVLRYGYQYAFMLTSTVLFIGGVFILFGLVPHPTDVGLPATDSEESLNDSIDSGQDSDADNEEPLLAGKHRHKTEKAKPIGFFQAVLLPGVIMYSLCYACLKMVNYSFLFWLPYYLSNKFHWAESVADEISVWYDVGGIVGGIAGGLLSDVIRKRSVVIFYMLLLAIPSLWIFSTSSDSKAMNSIYMTIVGFFVGGAANIISGTISADLGRQDAIQGNSEALATVTGIVDGTGSVGAALGQIFVPLIQLHFNWFFVFYFFIACCILTNICILPLFIRESKELYVSMKNSKRSTNTTSYAPINVDNQID